jgi:hypothetical protein
MRAIYSNAMAGSLLMLLTGPTTGKRFTYYSVNLFNDLSL